MKNKNREIDWGDIPLKAKSPLNREVDWGDRYSEGSEHLKKLAEALGGAGVGAAQGLSDVGANIAHFPSEAYTYLTGKPGYDTPKPDIREFAPQSETGKQFEEGGEIVAPFIGSPTLAAESTLGKTMFGGKILPRLLADMLGGAAESGQGNRETGAALGAVAPAAGRVSHYLTSTPKTKAAAGRAFDKVRNAASKEGELGIPMSIDFLRNMEYQMGSKHLQPSKMQLNTLMGNAAKGDYDSYHALQSALGDISRELRNPEKEKASGIMGMLFNNGPKSSAAERLTGKQVEDMRSQYIAEALEHLNKTGKGKVAKLEKKARTGYREYKNSIPLRNAVLGSAAGGIPGYELIKHFLSK